MTDHERCSWCDRAVDREDGWRLHELPGARRAAFCRLEHVVPWSIQGAHWEAVAPGRTASGRTGPTCADRAPTAASRSAT